MLSGNPSYWAPATYSACSAACGPGTQVQSQTCLGDCLSICQPGAVQNTTVNCTIGMWHTYLLMLSHNSPGTPYAYTDWTPWSACNSSCGTGVQTRTQTNCTGDCGPTCSAPLNPTQSCTIGVPYYLSAWSDWGNCSQYCGTGIQTRNQTCLGTCSNSSSICQGGAVSLQTTACTGGELANPLIILLTQMHCSWCTKAVDELGSLQQLQHKV